MTDLAPVDLTNVQTLSLQVLTRSFGAKVAGLARVPPLWRPATLLIPTDLFSASAGDEQIAYLRRYFKRVNSIVTGWAQHSENSTQFILRSSSTHESLRDRGKFLSVIINDIKHETLSETAYAIYRQFRESGAEGDMGLALQPYFAPRAQGHLANFRRVSKTRNHWQLELVAHDRAFAHMSNRSVRFNSQRSDPASSHDPLPAAESADELTEALKSVASWAAMEIDPVISFEWVLDAEGLRIVQCDDEVDPPTAVDPKMIKLPLTGSASTGTAPGPFERYVPGSGSILRKLRALDDFSMSPESTLPEIHFASLDHLKEAIKQDPWKRKFIVEFESFAPDGGVLRTDYTDVSGVSGMNLPRSGLLTGASALAWLENLLSERSAEGDNLEKWFVLLHRFVPARASAWSYAAPKDRIVRVDALWGIPDGIQYYPHDTFEYDLVEAKIVRDIIEFKPYFIWPAEKGSWTKEVTKSRFGRAQSVRMTDIRYIAEYTSQIAKKIDGPAQVMWFCDFPEQESYDLPLPWYREQHTVPPKAMEAAPPLPEIRVHSAADLHLSSIIGLKNPHKLILDPSSDEIRSRQFLDAVIDTAKRAGHSVVLEGSELAHAFHQLTSAGISVYSSRNARRRRTIRKQEFGKLVRDKIPQIVVENGDFVTYGKVPSSVKRHFLIAKAFEELWELARADAEEREGELADLHEVIQTLLSELKYSPEQISEAANQKRLRRGGFGDGVVLVGTTGPKDRPGPLFEDQGHSANEVSAAEALRAASGVAANESRVTVPIFNLLLEKDGVVFRLPGAGNRSARLQLIGDRLIISLAESEAASHQLIDEQEL